MISPNIVLGRVDTVATRLRALAERWSTRPEMAQASAELATFIAANTPTLGPAFVHNPPPLTDEEREFLRARDDTDTLRSAWPDRTWQPWEDPPIGTRVTRSGLSGTVVGRCVNRVRTSHSDVCASCTCLQPDPLFGRWLVRLDCDVDAIDYPPTLRRVP